MVKDPAAKTADTTTTDRRHDRPTTSTDGTTPNGLARHDNPTSS